MNDVSNNSALQHDTPRTLTDQAYGKIRDDIISGEFLPGSKLRIDQLKQRYQMGATPLREALSRLTENGFVTVEGQRGFKVSESSLADLDDITNLRVELENLALRQSILHGDDDWESNIIASFHHLGKIETAVDPDLTQWEERNRQFHQALISASNSPWTKRFYETLYDQHKRYRNLARLDRKETRDVHAEHKAIRDAVLDRDVARACKENEKHIRRTAEVVARIISEENKASNF